MAEHRLALGKVPHRPGRRVARGVAGPGEQVRTGEPALGLAGMRPDLRGREAERLRLAPPAALQRAPVDVALRRPRQQRRLRRQVRVVLRLPHAALGHGGLDLRPARREGVDDLARDARDLEAAVRMGLLDAVAQLPEALGEFGAVDRPDRHLAVEQPVVDHRAPLAVAALDHVGDDRVGVKLGVEIARRVVPEGGGDHLLAPGPDHRPGGLVAQPGLYGVLLDPAQRRVHHLVVRRDDAFVAAHHRHQGDRLGRAQRHVAARPVRDAAVGLLPPEPPPARACPGPVPGNLAFEDPPERLRIDRAFELQRRRALARPGARLAVRPVVLRVVTVPLEIPHALRRRGDLPDRGYHRGRARAAAGLRDSGRSIPARYALAARRTGAERTVSPSRRRESPHADFGPLGGPVQGRLQHVLDFIF